MSLNQQLPRFIVTGVLAVLTDLCVYTVLVQLLFPIAVAKGTSFLSGTVLAFFLNKYWTFDKPDKSVKEAGQFLGLYMVSLGLNVLVNQGVLSVFPGAMAVAFLVATGTSTVVNFLGQKFWVFK